MTLMQGLHYGWERYWLPRTEPLSLSNGFLPDPEAEYGHFNNPALRTLASLMEIPVVILLGEPGMGKSTSLEDEARRLREAGEVIHHCRLEDYGSEVSFREAVFEDPVVQTWIAGTGTLHLFLDSFDECTIPKADKFLLRGIDSLPTDRLELRISCRTADWPASLTGALLAKWGNNAQNQETADQAAQEVNEYELVPLRILDVVDAARKRGIDADAFLSVVRDKEIGVFAARPVSLRMLLDIWLKDGGLPNQRAGIYQRGCELLAAENNATRREEGDVGAFSAGQRMALAGRIAAMMQLSGKTSIWNAAHEWHAGENDLIRRELLGWQEEGDHITFAVDEKSLDETLGCALFTGHGPERMDFGHQSWQEFLAAWYLTRRLTDPARLLYLLQVGPEKRIAPIHTELVAWLAEISPGVFDILLDREPAVLLRGDLSGVSLENKARLLEALLRGCDAHRFNPWDWGLRRHLRKLNQPALAELLEPWITNTSFQEVTRNLALEIALACACLALSSLAADLVLDGRQPKGLRSIAVHLAALDRDQRIRLKAMMLSADLAKEQIELHDELRAALLTRLWPEDLSTAELFSEISTGNGLRCLGEYQYAAQNFIERFRPEDLRLALAWLESGALSHTDYDKHDLADAICLRAWDKLNEPGILAAFARVVRRSYRDLEQLFNRRGRRVTGVHPFAADVDKRHLLSDAVIALIENVDLESHSLLNGEDRLIYPEDLSWLLARYTASESESEKNILAICLNRLFDWRNQDSVDRILTVASLEEHDDSHPLLDELAYLMGPIWLGSPREATERKSLERRKQFDAVRPPPLDPPPATRVVTALAGCLDGPSLSWDRLWQEMMLPDGATTYHIDYKPITATPGWQRLTECQKEHVLQCARRWVIEYPLSDAEMHLESGQLAYVHIASYLALCCLADLRPQWLREADESLWRRWLDATVAYPYSHDSNQRAALLALAHSLFPGAVLEVLRDELRREIAAGETWLHALDDLLRIWNDPVADLVRGFLSEEMPFSIRKSLFSALLEHQDETAIGLTLELLAQPASDDLPMSGVLDLARRLLIQAPNRCWPVLWSRTQSEESFGIALWSHIAHHFGFQFPMLKELRAEDLAEFYRWLEARFPEAQDPVRLSGESYSPTPLDDMAHLRSAVVSGLSSLGVDEAISAINALSEEYPDKAWIKHALVNAQAIQRNQAWHGIPPDQLMTYLERAEARFARNGDELLEAVVASLARLQTLLQGDNPLAPFLWNVATDQRSGRPKSEDRLSDFVLQHLRRDLPFAVIDREVQVDNPRESGIPRRTDIKIEARQERQTPIVLVIETKGCWNDELMTSMQNQLKERYLRPLGAQHGLYLVGWYACDFWQGQESKRRMCERAASDPVELHGRLQASASSYSDQEFRLGAFVLDVRHPA